MPSRVVIVGGGFAGLNAAKSLGRNRDVEVTLIDRNNHHLFQPLLYQVATAGLSPAEIAAPIRNILSRYPSVTVLQGLVTGIQPTRQIVETDFGEMEYDYLILACGATHSYFGMDQWEALAPGLKTIEDATEIRRRILTAYEEAEKLDDPELQKKQLTFVIVGGGPTGVEMAGAIGEMSRFTLARDFRKINARQTRVFLIEAGPRILSAFPADLADRGTRDLEKLGVQVWTNSRVTAIDDDGVSVGHERLDAATVIWAAGVQVPKIQSNQPGETDRQGRVVVDQNCCVNGYSNIFVIGDQAHFSNTDGEALPGLAPVAVQQGKYVAKLIKNEIRGKPRKPFKYRDKGIMATIGRNKAVVHTGKWKVTGWFAWVMWLVIHIYFLTGFRNRLFVVMQWAWSYLTYRRGARLIVGKPKSPSGNPAKTSGTSPESTSVEEGVS